MGGETNTVNIPGATKPNRDDMNTRLDLQCRRSGHTERKCCNFLVRTGTDISTQIWARGEPSYGMERETSQGDRPMAGQSVFAQLIEQSGGSNRNHKKEKGKNKKKPTKKNKKGTKDKKGKQKKKKKKDGCVTAV